MTYTSAQQNWPNRIMFLWTKLVAALVNEWVGEWSKLQARANHGSVKKLQRVLSRVSDAAPESIDQL
jgi:hypothetical protein